MMQDTDSLVRNAFESKELPPKVMVLSYGSKSQEKKEALKSIWKVLQLKEENGVFAIQQDYVESCYKQALVESNKQRFELNLSCEMEAASVADRIAEIAISKGYNLVWDMTDRAPSWVLRMCNLARSRGYILCSLEPEGTAFEEISEFLSPIVDQVFRYPQLQEPKPKSREFEKALDRSTNPFCIESYVRLKDQKKRFSTKFPSYLSSIAL